MKKLLSPVRIQEDVLASLSSLLEDAAVASNPMLLLMAGTVYAMEGNWNDALKCCNSTQSLELCAPSPTPRPPPAAAPAPPERAVLALAVRSMALQVQVLIKMDRPDAAEKVLKAMQAADDDATLTQLAAAYVALALGGAKIQEAFYVFQELGDKYSWTVKLYNGSAVCRMQMGQYDDAEKDLIEALNKV